MNENKRKIGVTIVVWRFRIDGKLENTASLWRRFVDPRGSGEQQGGEYNREPDECWRPIQPVTGGAAGEQFFAPIHDRSSHWRYAYGEARRQRARNRGVRNLKHREADGYGYSALPGPLRDLIDRGRANRPYMRIGLSVAELGIEADMLAER